MNRFKAELERIIQHDDAGSWYYAIKTLKTRYKRHMVNDEFDKEILSHFDALLEIFEDAAMPIK